MASSRRSSPYDPYTAPYNYPCYPYPVPPASALRTQGSHGSSSRGFFADAEPEAAAPKHAPRARKISIPAYGPEHAETKLERGLAPKKPAPSAAEAAARLQAAARGFLARKSVRAVREVEQEAEEARARIAREVEALREDDARPRLAVGEALMRLLLRLDAVRGARDYRRRVTRQVLALQDAVDALEPKHAVAEAEADGFGTAEESAEAGHTGEVERETMADAATDTKVDDAVHAAEHESATANGDATADANMTEGSDAESEWEMVVAEERAGAAPEAASSHDAPPRQEPAGLETATAANAGGDSDGVDSRRVMETVAALCERNAQQCAVIAALAQRVNALERAVRRMEDAEPRQ